MADAKPLASGTVLTSNLGQYTIIRVLGSGGFGITYQVETKVQLHNITATIKLAVKEHYISSLCSRDSDTHQITFSEPVEETVTKSRHAFVKEARRLQTLGVEHPNIVRINEVFEANNTAYYVMEYLEGETLQEYVKRRGALSYAETLEIMRPIVDAVKTLHLNNIAHYDIKPANIILAHTDDGSMRPVLIDFGLSKHYDEDGDPTSTLDSGGYSPGYASIEQHAGLSTYNPQSDVYALAATMYYCLVGKKPPIAHEFDVKTLPALLGAKAPAEFVTTLQQAMAYSKMDRIPNASEFYDRVYKNQATDDTTSEHTVIYDNEETRIDPTNGNAGPTVPKNEYNTTSPESRDALFVRPTDEPDIPTGSNRKWLWIGLVALILIGGGATAFFLLKDKSTTAENSSSVSSENANQYPPEEEVIASARQRYDIVGAFKEDMAVVGKDGKWGFIDRNGKEVVAPKYDYAVAFSDGLAPVVTTDNEGNYKRSFIDKNGKVVIALEYDFAGDFSEGLAPVYKDGKYGFIDKTGNLVIPLKYVGIIYQTYYEDRYDHPKPFSEGLAMVQIGDWGTGKWGFIDRKGNEIIAPKYDGVKSFSEGLAMVEKDYKRGFIDKNGKVVIPLEYDYAESFSEGLAPVYKDGKWGFIDKTGKEVVALNYVRASSISEGLAPVVIADNDGNIKGGFIDRNGKEVIPLKYDAAEPFSEGLAVVALEDNEGNPKFGFIDKNGKEVIPLEYDLAWNFMEGLAGVSIKDNDGNYKCGFIDRSGKVVIPFDYYEEIQPFFDGLAPVRKDGKWGYIDTAGNVMWLPEE